MVAISIPVPAVPLATEVKLLFAGVEIRLIFSKTETLAASVAALLIFAPKLKPVPVAISEVGTLVYCWLLKENVVVTTGRRGIKEVPTGLLIFAWKLMAWLATVAPLVEGLPAPAVNSRDDNCAFVIAVAVLV